MEDGQKIMVTTEQIGPSKSLRTMTVGTKVYRDFDKSNQKVIHNTITRLRKSKMDFRTKVLKIDVVETSEEGEVTVEKEVIRVWRVA